MSQIIYCSPTIREQSKLLPIIKDDNWNLIEETFEKIYCLFGKRTVENQFSYYFGKDGKEKLLLNDIINRMENVLYMSGNNNRLTVWNEMIELTPYNYTNQGGVNVAIHIFDTYINEIYLNRSKKFQVATNIRYNNISKNALLILTICTSSFNYNGVLNISGNDLSIKAQLLKRIIRSFNKTKREPMCKIAYSQDKIYKYIDYEDTKMKSVIYID